MRDVAKTNAAKSNDYTTWCILKFGGLFHLKMIRSVKDNDILNKCN